MSRVGGLAEGLRAHELHALLEVVLSNGIIYIYIMSMCLNIIYVDNQYII